MIHLDFKIDPKYIAFHTVIGTGEDFWIPGSKAPRKEVEEFQKFASNVDQSALALSFLQPEFREYEIVADESFEERGRRADVYLKKLTDSEEIKPVIKQCMDALSMVREEWESNYQRSFDLISELTGIELEKTLPVYISHPLIRNGANYHERIFWTYRLDWPNYNTVYLWHEALHTIIKSPDQKGRGDVEHATIQFLSDNELRVRLNGGSYPPLEGHEWLMPLSNKLLPAWKEYLKQKNKNIYEFISTAKAIAGKSSHS